MNQTKKNRLSVFAIVAVAIVAAALFLPSLMGGQPPADNGPMQTDPVTGEQYRFTTYQALYLKYVDGGSSWEYPEYRTWLSELALTSNGKPVSTVQANLIFNFNSTKQVSKIVFNAEIMSAFYSENKQFIQYVSTWTPVAFNINAPNKNEDMYLTSSTVNASLIQALTMSIPLGNMADTYYYVVRCRSITAQVTYSDATTRTVGIVGVQGTENTVWWKFSIAPVTLEIVSLATEWEGD
jgi:hypothetical protein